MLKETLLVGCLLKYKGEQEISRAQMMDWLLSSFPCKGEKMFPLRFPRRQQGTTNRWGLSRAH